MYSKKEKKKQQKNKKALTPKRTYLVHVYGKRKRKNVIADNILPKTACVIKRERSKHSVIANTFNFKQTCLCPILVL